MIESGIKLSDADKLRLAQLRQKATLTRVRNFGEPRKFDNDHVTRHFPGFSAYSGQKKKPFIPHPPAAKIPSVTPQSPPSAAAATVSGESSRFVHGEKIGQVEPQAGREEITLTREECFCAVMDILLDGMSKADKASKEAAKHLMMVMENEAGQSVSLLVYNAYVRRYNYLRKEYFLSTAANIKAKTLKISSDIIASLEQMAKTVNIETLSNTYVTHKTV